MLVEFATFPVGEGESVSKYVAEAVKEVEKSSLPNITTPMSTIVEGDWDEVMDLVKKCHQAIKKRAGRVYTSITIDDRKDYKNLMEYKLKSLREKME